jgi:PAS domain S-box-containing protein
MLPENLFSLHGSEIGIADMQGIDGVMRLVAYSPLDAEPKGLRIAVGLDRDITFAAMTRANCTELVLIGAGAGLALAITAVLGRAVIRGPLDRLLVVAESWRSGDLVARTGIAANGSEFSRLAAAFDRMAEAQEVREHALRTALESTTDSVVVLDRDWRYTYLNERAKAQIGRGRDLLGKAVWDAFPGAAEHPGGEASEADDFYAMFGSRFETHAYPSADGMTIFFRDVTEERRNEQRFRTMFEQAAVGMMLAGLDRVPLQVNDRLCEITGYPREELLAKSFRDITHPDDRGMDDAQTRALLAGEIATFTVEKRYLRKDGQVVWVSLTVSLLRDQEGRPECHFGVIADITARQHRSGENLNE